MATLSLTAIWVNLMSTGAGVSGQSAPGRDEQYEVPGEVRTYGDGRRRGITQAGELGTYKFSLIVVDRTVVETLRGWSGQPVQVRDNKGRRFFGIYTSVHVSEYRSLAKWNVDIALSVITASEAV